MLLFSTITERSSSPPSPLCVDSNVKTDGANPTDHPKRREYDGKRTERKCKTYATRKKPIIVSDEDKKGHISEEQQLVQSSEDHFKKTANLKTEIPGNADDVNKCSFPIH
ncbi:MAG: hypothetical protein ACR5KX_04500 [Wolbachia sp.]